MSIRTWWTLLWRNRKAARRWTAFPGSRRLTIESLEARDVPAGLLNLETAVQVTHLLDQKLLSIVGSPVANTHVNVRLSTQGYEVLAGDVFDLTTSVNSSGQTRLFGPYDPATVQTVEVRTFGYNDVFRFETDLPPTSTTLLPAAVVVRAGAGSDVIDTHSYSGRDLTIYGESGRDFLILPGDLSNQAVLWAAPDVKKSDGDEVALGTTVPLANPVEGSIGTINSRKSQSGQGHGYVGGPRSDGNRLHQGLDIPGAAGTPIRAMADGVIDRANGYRIANGIPLIQVSHGSYTALYEHIDWYLSLGLGILNRGTGSTIEIRKGEIIGYIARAGEAGLPMNAQPHVHLQVYRTQVNPFAGLPTGDPRKDVATPMVPMLEGDPVARIYYPVDRTHLYQSIQVNIDRKAFLQAYQQTFPGRFSQETVAGLNGLLDQFERDPLLKGNIRYLGYLLALIRNGTNASMFVPVANSRSDGLSTYQGRGFVGMAGEDAYRIIQAKLEAAAASGERPDFTGVDVVTYPDKLLEPSIAYYVLTRGAMQGWFRLVQGNNPASLDLYLDGSTPDYIRAANIFFHADGLSEGQLPKRFTTIARDAVLIERALYDSIRGGKPPTGLPPQTPPLYPVPRFGPSVPAPVPNSTNPSKYSPPVDFSRQMADFLLASIRTVTSGSAGSSTMAVRSAAASPGHRAAASVNRDLPLVNETLGEALGIADYFTQAFAAADIDLPGADEFVTRLEEGGFTIERYALTPDARGDLLRVSRTFTWSPTNTLLSLGGSTGFSYFDDDLRGSLTGIVKLNGPTISFTVTFGVDIRGDDLGFFVDASSRIDVNGVNGTAKVGGRIGIGALVDVRADATLNVDLGASLTLQDNPADNDGKLRLEDLFNSSSYVGVLRGSLNLAGSLTTKVPILPDVTWTGRWDADFKDGVLTTTTKVDTPSATSVIAGLVRGFLENAKGFDLFRPAAKVFDTKLPLLGGTLGDELGIPSSITKFANQLTSAYDSIAGDLETLKRRLKDELGLEVLITPSSISDLIHGRRVDLIRFIVSGRPTVDVGSLPLPPVIVIPLGPTPFTITLKPHVAVSLFMRYHFGIGLDTTGFYLDQRTSIGFGGALRVGLEGSLNLAGFLDLATLTAGASLSISAELGLRDPDPSDGRIYIDEIRRISETGNLFDSFLGIMEFRPRISIDGFAELVIKTPWPFPDITLDSGPLTFDVIEVPGTSVTTTQTKRVLPLSSRESLVLPVDGEGTLWIDATTVQAETGALIALSKDDSGVVVVNWAGRGIARAENVRRVRFLGSAGNDRLTTSSAFDLPIHAEGGAGDDFLQGGAGNDILSGGTGNDILLGGFGDDVLHGNENDDTFQGGSGKDTLYGGTGKDDLSGGADADKLYGGDEDDVLSGNTGNDELYGEAGNDELYGDEGNDILMGGIGDDQLSGGLDRDLLDGGDQNDTLRGGAGNDTLMGGQGNDRLLGEADDDELQGGADDDDLDGGTGADVLYGDDIAAILTGHDYLRGGEGNDILHGGKGNDHLAGDAGLDVLYGGTGDDTFLVNVGTTTDTFTDTVYGGDDRDSMIVRGTERADELVVAQVDVGLFRVSRRDRSPGSSTGDVTVRVGGDIENFGVDAGAGDDLVRIDAAFNPTWTITLRGGEGNDTLYGGLGRDILIGDLIAQPGIPPFTPGNDVLYGMGGDDELLGGGGNDTLYGNQGNDLLIGDDGNDVLDGGEGRDILQGGVGNDRLIGGSGPLGDMLYGDAGDDVLLGGEGADVLSGGPDNDVLFGGDLLDILNGDDGHDILIGEGGRDFLFGGTGNDLLYADFNDELRVQYGLERAQQPIVLEPLIDFYFAKQTNPASRADMTAALARRQQGITWTADDELKLRQRLRTFYLEEQNTELRTEKGELDDRELAGYPPGHPRYFTPADAARQQLLANLLTSNYLELISQNIHQTVFVDTLDGGEENDTLIGSAFADRLLGGGGNDLIYHTRGDDAVEGGAGEDTYVVKGTESNDIIDLIYVRTYNAVDVQYGAVRTRVTLPGIEVAGVDALGGNDRITVRFDDYAGMLVRVEGGSGDDYLDASTFKTRSTLLGGTGNDTLLAGGGSDDVQGGDNDDLLIFNDSGEQETPDTYDGGVGHDRLVIQGTDQNDSLIVSSKGASINSRTISLPTNIEFFEMHGKGGNDTLTATLGAAILDGGDGDDVLTVGTFTGTVVQGGSGFNSLTIVGNDGDSSVGPPNSLLEVDDSLALSQSTPAGMISFGTMLSISNPTSVIPIGTASRIDRLAIETLGGHDRVNATGLKMPVTILGGAGMDWLIGSPDSDILDGGADRDTLVGGGGVEDRFILTPGSTDTIEGTAGTNNRAVYRAGGGETITVYQDGLRVNSTLIPVTFTAVTSATYSFDVETGGAALGKIYRKTVFDDTTLGIGTRPLTVDGSNPTILNLPSWDGAYSPISTSSDIRYRYLSTNSFPATPTISQAGALVNYGNNFYKTPSNTSLPWIRRDSVIPIVNGLPMFRVHPNVGVQPVISWTSPIEGRVLIHGFVRDLDQPTSSYAATYGYYISKQSGSTTSVLSSSAPPGRAAALYSPEYTFSIEVNVKVGDNLFLGIDALGSTSYDTTGVGLRIDTLSLTTTPVDKVAPYINAPQTLYVEAAGPGGGRVDYSPITARDNGVTLPVTASPTGTLLPLGSTAVTLTAKDAANNVRTQTMNVVVRDMLAPSINAEDIVVSAAGPNGTRVIYKVTATDAVTTTPTLTYSHAPTTLFPSGLTVVTVTATDAAGNARTTTFRVIVTDDTAPVFTTLPTTVFAEATGTAGANVSFTLPRVTDNGDMSPTIQATASSGALFGVGSTPVMITATDRSGNEARTSFLVTVRDTTPPRVLPDPTTGVVPTRMVISADSSEGSYVDLLGLIRVADSVDPTPLVSLVSPTAGTLLPIGTTPVVYRLSDASGNTTTHTLSVVIERNNLPPVAMPDSYTIVEDTPLLMAGTGVLTNDRDPDGNSMTAQLVTGVTHGTLTFNADGTFQYIPQGNFNGTDHFTYRAQDAGRGSDPTTVTIIVTAVNDAPLGRPDVYTLAEDSAWDNPQMTVLSNDEDVESRDLRAILTTPPSHGSLTLEEDGTFRYIPTANYHGTDTFIYRVSDGVTTSQPVTVTLNVTAVADVPTPQPDSYSLLEDTTLTVGADQGVLRNDTHGDGLPQTVELTAPPSNGTLTLHPSGAFTYVPQADSYGTDRFGYRVSDGRAWSETTWVTLIVQPVNDSPRGQGDAYTLDEDTTLTVPSTSGLLANDRDDSTTLTATLVTNPANGTLSLSEDGSFVYVPRPNFSGTDTFRYRVGDGELNSEPITVMLMVRSIIDPLTPQPDSYTLDEDTTITVSADRGFLSNDGNVEITPLWVQIISGPYEGVFLTSEGGGFVYTPDANFNGTDYFYYRANNGSGWSDPITVTLTIRPVTEILVARENTYTVSEDFPLNIPAGSGILANDSGEPGVSFWAVLERGPSHGTLTLNTNGAFTYQNSLHFNGTDSFAYRITDGNTISAPATVTIRILAVNDSPYPISDSYTVAYVGMTRIPAMQGVLANDYDVDGDALTLQLVSSTMYGTLSLRFDGSFDYTPSSTIDWVSYYRSYGVTSLRDSFSYRLTDPSGMSSTQGVDITIPAPAVSVNDRYTLEEDSLLRGRVSLNDSLPNGRAYQIEVDQDVYNGTLQMNSDGTFVYVPQANMSGIDSFRYRLIDERGFVSTAWVDLNITAINDPPIAQGESYSMHEDERLERFDLLANDSDVESSFLTTILEIGPSNGSLELRSNGSFVYTPNPNFFGTDQFSYRVNDGSAVSEAVTVNLTITPVNDTVDAPTLSRALLEDSTLLITQEELLAGRSDVDGDSLTVQILRVSTGTLTQTASGSFLYTPPANYHGAPWVLYRLHDGTAYGGIGVLRLTVTPVADIPVAVGDIYRVLPGVGYGFYNNARLLVNDYDADGQPLRAVLVSNASRGVVNLRWDGGFSYVPRGKFYGVDRFQYLVTDGQFQSKPVEVVLIGNTNPVGRNDAYTAFEGRSLVITGRGVLSNDYDIDGHGLRAVLKTGPTNGTLTLSATGGFKYTPKAGFRGTDLFTYQTTDNLGYSNTVPVSIVVRPINRAPVLSPIGTVQGNPNKVLRFTARGTDSPGDILRYSLLPGAPAGASLHPVTGVFTWTPSTVGTWSVKVRVSDNGNPALSAVQTVTLKVVYPVVLASTPDQTLQVSSWLALRLVVQSPSAPEDSIRFAFVGEIPVGLRIDPVSGILEWRPQSNQIGSHTIEVLVVDGLGQQLRRTLRFTVIE